MVTTDAPTRLLPRSGVSGSGSPSAQGSDAPSAPSLALLSCHWRHSLPCPPIRLSNDLDRCKPYFTFPGDTIPVRPSGTCRNRFSPISLESGDADRVSPDHRSRKPSVILFPDFRGKSFEFPQNTQPGPRRRSHSMRPPALLNDKLGL